MMPPSTAIVPDDVFERLMFRAQAEGKTLDEVVNEALRWGLMELHRKRPIEKRNYAREMDTAT